jgi:HEAT repeat protein
MEPYRGLQPYTEEYEEYFFGRDAERAILIDKILSDKLTLLFSATGVGKSSLLQAAVMPELKRPAQENLDVVYYKDWITSPLTGLKQKLLEVLQERGKIDTELTIDENLSLKEFLHICATFASEPLVVILDQFEEFFRYQHYTDIFNPFIVQLSEAIRDRDTSVTFLISMREDFALNLNAFKEYLSTTLFENYYRLEKLNIQEAREAINKPVEKMGFSYEKGLLEELLKDLADQEREGRIGGQKVLISENAPSFVEPPNVQIVCTQLWEFEKANPNGVIRSKTYNERGGPKGFINSYFESVITAFSSSEKQLASKAFDHLVTPRGTKMAYPVKDLSQMLKVDEHDLDSVLAKLEKARVLRSQSRKGVIWYELYHDFFSGIIHQWNDAYKTKQRNKHSFIGAGITVVVLLLFFAAYNIIPNLTNYHFRLSVKELSDQIELYRGKAKSLDIAHLQRYKAEIRYKRDQIEPDKLFIEKPITNYDDLNLELIEQFPIVKRVLAYWKAGKIDKALELMDKSISRNDMTRTKAVIDLLTGFRSQKSFEVLKKYLAPSEDVSIRTHIISTMGYTQFAGVTDCLIPLLKDQNSDLRGISAVALGQLGGSEAMDPLVELLKDRNPYVRENAAWALGRVGNNERISSLLIELLKDQNLNVKKNAAIALGQLGSDEAIDQLVELLKDQDWNVRNRAMEALVQIGSKKAEDSLLELLKDEILVARSSAASVLGRLDSNKAVGPLVELLEDKNWNVRFNAAWALGQLDNEKAIDSLEILLKDPDEYVRRSAVAALGQLGSSKTAKLVVESLKDQDECVRQWAITTLGQFGSSKALRPLVEFLKDQKFYVRSSAATALGQIGNSEAVEPLIELLQDPELSVRRNAAEALGQLGSSRAVEPLIELLQDPELSVRRSAAGALGQLGSEAAVEPLVVLLQDPDLSVRRSAAGALGQLGSEAAVEPLVVLLQDPDLSVRHSAAEALGQLGSGKAVELLIELLQDPDVSVRRNAVEAIGQLGSNEAVELMIELLQDPEASVRRNAVEALGQLGSSEVVGLLLQLLKKQNQYRYNDVRDSVAEALGQLGSEQAVQQLIARLTDENADVRSNAAKALGQLGSDEAVEPLMMLLKDQGEDVRERAALALGKLSAGKAIDSLKKFYNKESQAKLAVASALLSLEQEDGLEFLQEKSKSGKVKERKEVTEVLGEAPSEQGNVLLIAMINDENADVKIQAITSLGRAQAVSSLPYLHKLLEDPNPKIRKAGVEALGEIASLESVDFLRETALNTEERVTIRIAAIEGLEKIDTEEAVAALIEVLEKADKHYHYKQP